jgi:hypothetical protein
MYYLSVLRDIYDEKLLCLITISTSYPTSFKLDPQNYTNILVIQY